MSLARVASLHAVTASDIDLVRATRAGDDDAFEELYRRYRGQITSFVGCFVRDEGRTEDVVQEAFVSALRRIRATDREIRFKPWIYEIARNAAIDLHRRRRVAEVSLDAEGGLAAGDERRLTGSPPPEVAVIDSERFEHFRGALDELSETHHRIIVLRELEGLSYREIGVRMELSSAAVESALFRARRKLEDEYEQLETGRRCQSIRTLIARQAEGVDSGRDRRRLERHARRCWSCRRLARQLGVAEPIADRSRRQRALALLPLPALVRRIRAPDQVAGPGGAGAGEGARMIATPGVDTLAQAVQKAAAVAASALVIGGGGATLGGVGPLAIDAGLRAETTGKPAAGARPGSQTGRDSESQEGSQSRATAGGSRQTRGARSDAGGRPSMKIRQQRDGRRGISPPAPSAPMPGPALPKLPPRRPTPPDPRLLPPAAGPRPPGLPNLLGPAGPTGSTPPSLPAVPGLPTDPKPKQAGVGSLAAGVAAATKRLGVLRLPGP